MEKQITVGTIPTPLGTFGAVMTGEQTDRFVRNVGETNNSRRPNRSGRRTSIHFGGAVDRILRRDTAPFYDADRSSRNPVSIAGLECAAGHSVRGNPNVLRNRRNHRQPSSHSRCGGGQRGQSGSDSDSVPPRNRQRRQLGRLCGRAGHEKGIVKTGRRMRGRCRMKPKQGYEGEKERE